VRALLGALAATLVVGATGASVAPAAKEQDASVFGGLGTWTDIYDGRVYAQP
jgi:hypothetical protein